MRKRRWAMFGLVLVLHATLPAISVSAESVAAPRAARVSLVHLYEREPNGAWLRATPISVNSTTSGMINDFLQDEDYYLLHLNSPLDLKVRLTGGEPELGEFFRVDLLDDQRNLITEADIVKFPSYSDVRLTAQLQPGHYYLKVYTDLKSPQVVNHAYSLQVTQNDGQPLPEGAQVIKPEKGVPSDKPPGELERAYWLENPKTYKYQLDYKYQTEAFDHWAKINGRPDQLPNDPQLNRQYHLAQVNALNAWQITTGSPIITVAIIDQGIDDQTQELYRQVLPAYSVQGPSSLKIDHGTHTTGIIAAEQGNGIGVSGIAPGVRILPINAWDSTGKNRTPEATAEAIRYAADHGARVLNMSILGNNFAPEDRGDSPIIRAAVEYAHEKGVVMVASSGNSKEMLPHYPAAYEPVIAVGNISANDELYVESAKGNDLVAPGDRIFSTGVNGNYLSMTGTSMAAPVVAGAAALVLSKNPELTPDEVSDILFRSAVDLGEPGFDPVYGHGRLDVYRALQLTPEPKHPVKDLPFDDLAGHWARSTVKNLWQANLVQGMTSDRYEPEGSLTRAQFATLLNRALALPKTNRAAFTDVVADDWFAASVNATAEAAIVEGTGEGRFTPNRPVTRGEMAIMLDRAWTYKFGADALPKATGTPSFMDETIDPQRTATRAESAQVIRNFLTEAENAAVSFYQPKLITMECPFHLPETDQEVEGKTYSCGQMEVPQDRTKPDGMKVQVAYTVLKSRSSTPAPDPLVHLEGGPAASAVELAPKRAERYDSIRKNRDVVLFDIRGAGFSEPRLDCSPYYPTAKDQAWAKCRTEFEQKGFDFNQYTTTINAADAVDLAQALGYQQVNLVGVSYGTRLGMEIMRQYPDMVRSSVLDSIAPPHIKEYEEFGPGKVETMLRVFDDCAADTECNAAYPNLKERFFKLLEKLEKEPVTLGQFDVLDAKALAGMANSLTNEVQRAPYFPKMIAEIEQGVYDTYKGLRSGQLAPRPASKPIVYYDELFLKTFYDLARALSREEFTAADKDFGQTAKAATGKQDLYPLIDRHFEGANRDGLKELADKMTSWEVERLYSKFRGGSVFTGGLTRDMNLLVDCRDQAFFNQFDGLADRLKQLPLGQYVNLERNGDPRPACQQYGVGPVDAAFRQPVVSDIPTLALVGRYDGYTPMSWALDAMSHFSRSHVVTMDANHAVLGLNPVAVSIMEQFINDPAQEPDTSAIPSMKFVVGDAKQP